VEPILVVALCAAGAGVALWATQSAIAHDRRHFLKVWSRVGEAGVSGLAIDPQARGATVLRGTLGTCALRIERGDALRDASAERPVRFIVEGDAELSLRPETLSTRFEKTIAGYRAEIETGDEAFDRAVFVQGSEPVARALLDAPARALLRPLLEGRLRYPGNEVPGLAVDAVISTGSLVVEVGPLFQETLHRQLKGALAALRTVAETLRKPADIPGRIAANLADEPEWRVRVACLHCLVEHWPEGVATREALARAAHDERLEVRLAVAKALPPAESRAVLRDIAAQEWAEDKVAAEAARLLGDAWPPDAALATLGPALRSRRFATAGEALLRLGASREARFVEPLVKVLTVEQGTLAAVAARALGALGSNASEDALREALALPRERDDELGTALAEALGKIGGTASVPTLKEVQASKTAGRRTKSAARQAVALIQSRVVGATPGQLSLAGSEAGQLALADDEPKGRLSLPESPPE
jgi:HEAT repeat protein